MPKAKKAFSLNEIALAFDLQVRGEGDFLVRGIANPEKARPEDLVFLVESNFLDKIEKTEALAYVGRPGDFIEGKHQILADNPRLAMARILSLFVSPHPTGIHPGAVVEEGAEIKSGVALGAHCFVGKDSVVGKNTVLYPNVTIGRDVSIGEDCLFYPGVVVREGCVIGNKVILQPGAVIGSDGYGFLPQGGHHFKIPQVGNVVIEDDVEIGANTAIDRGTIGSTLIKRGTKIDNLVHIAHNDLIGEDVLIVSQTGISGSVEVGDRCTLAGQVGIAGHLKVGSDCLVLARSGVTKDLPSRSVVSGFPAKPHREELKGKAGLGRLPGKLVEIEARLAELEKKAFLEL